MQNIELQALYRAYMAYCRDMGIPPESNKKFAASLRNLGYEISPGAQNIKHVKGVFLCV